MMKIAYLDCFAGISGDMLLGALVDLGVSLDTLKQELLSLGLSGYEITAQRVTRRGISGMKVDVTITGDQPHRHLKDILQILDNSRLSESDKQDPKNIFHLLAEAEGKIHGKVPENVHFHEVGAVDSIIDIVGTLIGLQRLKVEQVYCSPLNVGSGTLHCAHGVMPVPAPATAEILLDTPIYSAGPAVELVTPTGAVMVKYLAKGFGPMPGMILKAVGYGAGDRETQIPNLLRVMLGEEEPCQHLYQHVQGQRVHHEQGHCRNHEHKHA